MAKAMEAEGDSTSRKHRARSTEFDSEGVVVIDARIHGSVKDEALFSFAIGVGSY
jgi:hypothetical protein